MWDWVETLKGLTGHPLALVTVVSVKGSTPREPGAKLIVLPSGEFFGTIGGGQLERLAIEDAKQAIADAQCRCIRYPLGAVVGQCCGGEMELFFEVMNVGPHLYVFGAGHVGQAVSRTMAGTAFQVHLVDERETWLNSPKIPREVVRHLGHWSDFVDEVEWDGEKSYAVIMTHRHDEDQELIACLVRRPAKYIGLIGSQAKWRRFSMRLAARGFGVQELSRVHCPIGSGMLGKSPQEVAISLAADLLRRHYDSKGERKVEILTKNPHHPDESANG